jgi:hypothetical protein
MNYHLIFNDIQKINHQLIFNEIQKEPFNDIKKNGAYKYIKKNGPTIDFQ